MRILTIIYCFVFLGLSALDTTSAEPTFPENRFLIVVETSATTGRFAKAVRETVRDLVSSGIQGQMRPSDTLGIWTFNTQLNSSYPMRHWSPSAAEALGQDVHEFLRKLPHERKAFWDVVAAPIQGVKDGSKALTVILVTSGSEPISGTPFDAEINDVYESYGKKLRASRRPFVTALVAREGKFSAHAVNAAGTVLQIPNPPLPEIPPPAPAVTNLVKDQPAATAPPPRKVAKTNIVLAGKAPHAVIAVTNAIDKPIEIPKSTATETNVQKPARPTDPSSVSTTNAIEKPPVIVPQAVPANSPTVLSQVPASNQAAVKSKEAGNPVPASVPTNLPPSATKSTVVAATQVPSSNASLSSVPTNMSPPLIPVIAVQTQPTAMRIFILSGGSLALVALIAGIFRRKTRSAGPSLISRSIESKKHD